MAIKIDDVRAMTADEIEDKLLELVRGFFSRRIFGPNRHALLTPDQHRPTPTNRRSKTRTRYEQQGCATRSKTWSINRPTS